MKLLYNEEELFCTRTELLNFTITLPLAKFDTIGSRFASNYLNFSGNISVDIQLVTFLLLSNISELSLGQKTKKIS